MEKERKITAPDGCEIEKVELVDGVAVVTFREKERIETAVRNQGRR